MGNNERRILTYALIMTMLIAPAFAQLLYDEGSNAQGWYNFPINWTVAPLNAADLDDFEWYNRTTAGTAGQCLRTFSTAGNSETAGGAYAYIQRRDFEAGTYSMIYTGLVGGVGSQDNVTISSKIGGTWYNFTVGLPGGAGFGKNLSKAMFIPADGNNDGVGIPVEVNASGLLGFRLWSNGTGAAGFYPCLGALNLTNFTAAAPPPVNNELEVSNYMPPDNDHDNAGCVDFWVNATSFDGTVSNMTLWFNGVYQNYTANAANVTGTVFNNCSMINGAYEWNVTVEDTTGNSTNSSNWLFTYDTIDPTVTYGQTPENYAPGLLSNFVNASVIDDNLFNVTTELVYAANNTIFRVLNQSANPIGTDNYTLNISLPIDIPTDKFYINITSFDSHTAKEKSKNFKKQQYGVKQLKFKEDKKVTAVDYVGAKAPSKLTVADETDRYEWTYEFLNIPNDFKGKELIQSDYPITIVSNSDYVGHMVTGDKWIDYDKPSKQGFKIKLTQVNATAVNVEWWKDKYTDVEKNKLVFDPAIGGLNFNWAATGNFTFTNWTAYYNKGIYETVATPLELHLNSSGVVSVNSTFFWNGTLTTDTQVTTSVFTTSATPDIIQTNNTEANHTWNFGILFNDDSAIQFNTTPEQDQRVYWAHYFLWNNVTPPYVLEGDSVIMQAQEFSEGIATRAVNFTLYNTNYTDTTALNGWSYIAAAPTLPAAEYNQTIRGNATLYVTYNGRELWRGGVNNDTLVYKPALVPCGGLSNTIAVNFNFSTENNLTFRNATMLTTFTVYDPSRTTFTEFAYTDENVTDAYYCLYPVWATIAVDSVQQYYSDVLGDFSPRYYYLDNETITNSTYNNYTAYMLIDELVVQVKTTVKDSVDQVFAGAYVHFDRFYPGENIYRTVAMGLTDSQGQFNTYLDPNDELYRIQIFYDHALFEPFPRQQVTCESTFCNFNIWLSTGQSYDVMDNVGFAWFEPWGLVVDTTTDTITYNVNDRSGTASFWGFNVTTEAGALLYSDSSTTPTGGTLSVVLNTIPGIPTSEMTVFNTYSTVVNDNGVFVRRKGWRVGIAASPPFINKTGDSFGKALDTFKTAAKAGGVKESAFEFMALVVIAVIAGGVSMVFGFGGGIVALAAATILAAIGWLPWDQFMLAAAVALIAAMSRRW